ncbi:hypothetical protein D3C75_1338690 [compost metagenome]
MKFVFDQMQRKIHLLIFELGLDRDLFMGDQPRQQGLDLGATIDHQARGGLSHRLR